MGPSVSLKNRRTSALSGNLTSSSIVQVLAEFPGSLNVRLILCLLSTPCKYRRKIRHTVPLTLTFALYSGECFTHENRGPGAHTGSTVGWTVEVVWIVRRKEHSRTYRRFLSAWPNQYTT